MELLSLVAAVRFAVAILTAYFLPGHLILTSLRSKSEHLDAPDLVLLSVSLSVLVTTLALFCASLVSLPFDAVVLVLSIVVMCLETWRCRMLSFRSLQETSANVLVKIKEYLKSLSRFEKMLFAVVAYQLLVSLMHTVYWPIYSWDALGYWLYYGRAFYEEGTMNLISHQLQGGGISVGGMAYPFVIELLYAWLFTSAGKVDLLLANSAQTVFLLMLVLAVFQLFRKSGSRRVSFLGCLYFLLFSYAIASQWDVFKGVADFPLFVSGLTLMYFSLRFWHNPSAVTAFAAGVLGGLAGAIKQLGLVFIVLAGMLILLRSILETREGIISRATRFSVYAVGAFAICAPYYLYSVALTPAETITSWSPTTSSPFNLTTFLGFTLAVLHGVSPRAWGLSPIIAFIAVLIAWKKTPLVKIALFWIVGSVLAYYFFISTTQLGAYHFSLGYVSVPKYTLPIYSVFAVIAGGAFGAFWQKAQTERKTRRTIYSVIIVALLVSNVGVQSYLQSYLLPPFLTPTGTIVDRNWDEKYVAKLGGFYEVAMHINQETPPGSVIIAPGYYRYFFFNARDQRRLYGLERSGLWTDNLTVLGDELRSLNSSFIYVAEEPWYTGFAPYDFYFQSALYIHKQEIMTLVLSTDDEYLLYQVNQQFVLSNPSVQGAQCLHKTSGPSLLLDRTLQAMCANDHRSHLRMVAGYVTSPTREDSCRASVE